MLISIMPLYHLIGSAEFLFFTEILASLVKLYFLFFLITNALKTKKVTFPLGSLLVLLLSGFLCDYAWLIKLFRQLYNPLFDSRFVIFFIRLAWAFHIVQFQALCLFVESLTEKRMILNFRHKFIICLNFLYISYFVYLGFMCFNSPHQRPNLEFSMMNFCIVYLLIFVVIPSLYSIIKKLQISVRPQILKKQLITLIKYLLCPYVITECLHGYFVVKDSYFYLEDSISALIFTFAIYYAMQKVMGLRFLNFQNHVQAPKTFNFIDDFKNVLEKLSYTTSASDLRILTQLFFKDAFRINANATNLYIRFLANSKTPINDLSDQEITVERCINGNSSISSDIIQSIKNHKILIYDEIVFNNFYQENRIQHELIQFLERINAAVFLPIFENATLIAYIIIQQDGRSHEFFSNVERDEMLVFASYLGKIVYLLQNRNLTLLIAQEKELREELFQKSQENNQYKESIRSFLRSNRQGKIGILFYKNRRFTFANQFAKELIAIDLNILIGHPLTKTCKQLVEQVENYKTTQNSSGMDTQGNKLIFVAVPSLEQNTIIITVYYPEISDVIKKQIDLLKDPSEWDYLLYLETTKSGQLINQLIPCSGSKLLNFKIALLKTALSKKALLLHMQEEDLLPTVEIIHHISMREKLQSITLQAHKNTDIAIQLFGINPLLGLEQKPSLLEQLHNVGTLFIQNIHLLDIELQEKLAELIKYGYYTVYKGDQKIISDVRIIVSSALNLETLMHEGKFSPCLFNELQKTTLAMPLLSTLEAEEMHNLVDGLTQQTLRSPTFKNLLALTEKERNAIINDRPISLMHFKTKIQQLLINKSKKNNVEDSMEIDQTSSLSDPTLIQAARLGKKALKDPKILSNLWHKFKNQNKIASLLGVNRSSINRRFKEYDIN